MTMTTQSVDTAAPAQPDSPATAPNPTPPTAAAAPLVPAGSARPAAEQPEDRVPGFTVGETSYTFPAHVPVGWGLTYLRLFYTSGQDHALVWALAKLLGDGQLGQLEKDPALTREALLQATDACKSALLGGLEDPKGS